MITSDESDEQPCRSGNSGEHFPGSAPAEQLTSSGDPLYRPPDTVRRLHDHGAHFVLCDDDKKPLWSRYLVRRPSVRAILAHDGPVGIVPSSIGLICLDVDAVEDPFAVARLAVACHTEMVVESRRPGGRHIFVPDDLPRFNGQFSWLGCSGDIRGATGYVIIWKPAAWDILDHYVRHPPMVAPVGLPYALVARCRVSNGSAQHEEDVGRCGMRLEDVEGSQRNRALFDAVRHWAYRQDRGHDQGQWMIRVLNHSHSQNRRFRDPLPDHAVTAMADRIGWWVWENCVHKPNIYANLDPAERSERARQNGIKSGESRRRKTPLEQDREKPLRQPRLQAWKRLGISRSTWYRWLQKIRAGDIPSGVHNGWDHLGMGVIAPWECLGVTLEEWERWYAPTASPLWDTFATELNPGLGDAAGEGEAGGGEAPPAGQQGRSISAEYLDRVAECAVELVESVITAVPRERAPVIPISEREELGRVWVALQRSAAFEARKVATANRKEFQRRIRWEATEHRREEARRIRDSLRTALLDFLHDCEEARIEEERETGIRTPSWIASPVQVLGYDRTNPDHHREYAMMMSDVERKNWGTACFLFRRAQLRGEQPVVPPWLEESFIQALDLLDEWRGHPIQRPYRGIAAVA